MANIELWFPVAIYQHQTMFTDEQNKLWADYIEEIKKTSTGKIWPGGTYTTHHTHDLRTDSQFKPLIMEINSHMHSFAKEYGSMETYVNGPVWGNVATKENSQEFHTHNGSIFSAVYYVTAPEGSGSIIFEDPKEPDMLPVKNINKTNQNRLSFSRIAYKPLAGKLLIFRSNIRHMVESGTNESSRISISMNFH